MNWGALLSVVMFIILISLFGLVSVLVYDSYFSETQFFESLNGNNDFTIVNNTISDEYPGGILFYNNLRFPSNKISYSIEPQCNELRKKNAREAFSILEETTILDFTEESNGNIQVTCSQTTDIPLGEYFIAGEGGPTEIINASNFYVSNSGTILLYTDSTCNRPVVAIHEILHVLGFTHSINKKSIMYEVSRCDQKITKEILDTINLLYKTPTLPDLLINEVSAEKNGKLLNFEIEIFNAGLDFSSETDFSIFADGEEVAKYDLDELTYGTGRIISVSNLRVPRNFDKLSFYVDFESRISELNEDNNEQTLIIS